MTNRTIDTDELRATLVLACRAPSVHNSQPWRWRVDSRTVHLYADSQRWLPVTDQDGRDQVLSCGAALHHFRVALADFGIASHVHRLPDSDDPGLLASIELLPDAIAEPGLGSVAAIEARRTDRRRFNPWPVPQLFLDQLVQRATEQGAVLRLVSDQSAQRQLIAAIATAAATQAATPGYAEETAAWSGRRDSPDGVPVENALRAGDTGAGVPMREFASGELVQPADVEDGAVLMLLGSSSDDRLSQLRAGEAMSAVLLRATELELATCPLSQPLEVADTRATLREVVLNDTLSPQLALRVGWPPAGLRSLPPTPRRPLDEMVDIASR